MRRHGLATSTAREAQWHMRICTRDNWAGYRDTLSALHWDEGYQVYGYGDSAFPDGYGEVAARLAEGLPIRLNARVTEVRTTAHGVSVLTADAAFDADAAIITLPLGILKSGAVRFRRACRGRSATPSAVSASAAWPSSPFTTTSPSGRASRMCSA